MGREILKNFERYKVAHFEGNFELPPLLLYLKVSIFLTYIVSQCKYIVTLIMYTVEIVPVTQP